MVQTVTCTTCREIADLVVRCRREGCALVDYGRAHCGVGYRPPAQRLNLLLEGGVIEHYERDMTVRVSAGMTIGCLQESLAGAGQFFPVDADSDITLGEAINLNVYGPLRLKYGSMRELLLGLRYVDGEGRDIHVGGRTVKNVAGLDLTRFMVGGMGEFGVVYEATVRTYAIPEQVLAVDIGMQTPRQIDKVLTGWLVSDAAPTGLFLARPEGRWVLTVLYHGRAAACAVQADALASLAASLPGARLHDHRVMTLAESLDEHRKVRQWRRQAGAVAKLVVPPATTGEAAERLVQWAAGRDLLIDALPAHGAVFAGGDLGDSDTADLHAFLADVGRELNGFHAWCAHPADVDLPPFTPLPATMPLLRRLKQTMDPHGVLNPGRIVVMEAVKS
jgi:glycolate oxidase FAD binding subunit